MTLRRRNPRAMLGRVKGPRVTRMRASHGATLESAGPFKHKGPKP
jgi:hypothetical protein